MDQMLDLTGKTVVAIGGNSVLGSAMVKGMPHYGAQLAVVGINMETDEEVAEDIVKEGGEAKAFHADVTKKGTLKQAAKEIEAWAGGWDVLLNAPGTNSPTPFFDIDEEEWDHILDINLK